MDNKEAVPKRRPLWAVLTHRHSVFDWRTFIVSEAQSVRHRSLDAGD